VCYVSCEDAIAYCAWRSRRDGVLYRLPTDSEWEKAARGVDGRLFPWGSDFEANLCYTDESLARVDSPAPIGSRPGDVSPYGVRDLAGGVRDWTSSTVEGGKLWITRGGAWDCSTYCSRTASRVMYPATFVESSQGFRLAKNPPRRR
jgi:eukaryotic-like serine/threonine-protein kinase